LSEPSLLIASAAAGKEEDDRAVAAAAALAGDRLCRRGGGPDQGAAVLEFLAVDLEGVGDVRDVSSAAPVPAFWYT
jgi:hypothetical protein